MHRLLQQGDLDELMSKRPHPTMDLDLANVSELSEFAFGFAGSLLKEAFKEACKRMADTSQAKQAAKYAADLAEVHSKEDLNEKIGRTVVTALRTARITSAQLQTLKPLVQDAVVASKLADELIYGRISSEFIVSLLSEESSERDWILPIAQTFSNVLNVAFAEDTVLSRIKVSKRLAKIQNSVDENINATRLGFESMDARFDRLEDLATSGHSVQTVVHVTINPQIQQNDQQDGIQSLSEHLQKQFERAKKSLNSGSIKTAEREYRNLVSDLEEIGDTANRQLLLKSYTNLGAAFWHQNKNDKAVECFDKAFELDPVSSLARVNKLAAYIHRKEYDDAEVLLRALASTGENKSEVCYWKSIIALESDDPITAVAELKSCPTETSAYFESIAHAYLTSDQFADSESAARRALELDPNSTTALVLIANAIAFPFVRNIKQSPGGLSGQDHSRVVEAIGYADRAVAVFRNRELNSRLAECLTNLSAFHGLIGDNKNAASSAVEADKLTPNDHTTLTNLWASYMRTGDSRLALTTADRMIANGAGISAKLMRLEALFEEQEYPQIIEETKPGSKLHEELSRDPTLFELRAKSQFECGLIDHPFETLTEGLRLHSNNPTLLASRGAMHKRLNREDEAHKDFARANASDSDDPTLGTLLIAEHLFEQQDWEGAMEKLNRLGANSIHSPFFDKYLKCLCQARPLAECYVMSIGRLKAEGYDPTAELVAATSAFHMNELPLAREHLEKLIRKNHPQTQMCRKMLSNVLMRLGETMEAQTTLRRGHAEFPDDVDFVLGLSILDRVRSLEYALMAVDLEPEDIRTHRIFVQAVQSQPRGTNLAQEVIDRYQASIERLTSDSSGGMQAIDIGEDGKELLNLVKARSLKAQDLLNIVMEKNLPAAVLSTQLGLSPFETWLGLASVPELGRFLCRGTHDDQSRNDQLAAITNSVTVDISALFSLALLGRLHLLSDLFSQVIVHTSALEALVQDIRRMEQSPASMTLHYEAGQLISQKIDPEVTAAHVQLLKSIRDYLKSEHIDLCGLDPSLLTKEETEMIRLILGGVSYDPIAVAANRETSYLADDFPLRSIAGITRKVDGFSTQSVLRLASARRLITPDEYQDALILLLKHHYRFVSENAWTLIRLVQTELFTDDSIGVSLLSRIGDKTVEQKSMMNVFALFLVHLWRYDSASIKDSRENILKQCAIALARHPEFTNRWVLFLTHIGALTLPYPAVFFGILICFFNSGSLASHQHNDALSITLASIDHIPDLALKHFQSEQIYNDWRAQRDMFDRLITMGLL